MVSSRGRYRLSNHEMLSYGFKYGEPWGEDRRALERAFREEDTRSEGSSTSESTWTASSLGIAMSRGSTLSTLSSVSTLSSSGLSNGTATYGDTWGRSEREHSGGRVGGMEVVRVGGGNESARSVSHHSERASNARISSSLWHGDSGGASPYAGRPSYQTASTTHSAYRTSPWHGENGQHRAWWDSSRSVQSSSSYYGRPGTEEYTYHDYGSNGSFAGQGTYTGSFGHDHDHDHEHDSSHHLFGSQWDDWADEGESSGYTESTYDGPGSDSEYDSHGSFGSGSEEKGYGSESDITSDDSYDEYSD